ncbi:Protein of unknown function [Gryllus bimaculatus]|nr:Protein of unknown function [Gryllus bimaculatus]
MEKKTKVVSRSGCVNNCLVEEETQFGSAYSATQKASTLQTVSLAASLPAVGFDIHRACVYRKGQKGRYS